MEVFKIWDGVHKQGIVSSRLPLAYVFFRRRCLCCACHGGDEDQRWPIRNNNDWPRFKLCEEFYFHASVLVSVNVSTSLAHSDTAHTHTHSRILLRPQLAMVGSPTPITKAELWPGVAICCAVVSQENAQPRTPEGKKGARRQKERPSDWRPVERIRK